HRRREREQQSQAEPVQLGRCGAVMTGATDNSPAAVFEDIRLEFGGREYVIPANRVLPAIARVETVVTMHELTRDAMNNTFNLSRVAQGFGALLRFAGAKVTDDDIYFSMFGGVVPDPAKAVAALNQLFFVMVPPKARREAEQKLEQLLQQNGGAAPAAD